jgi:hypothetical protein
MNELNEGQTQQQEKPKPDEKEAKFVNFKGMSGQEFEIPETLYNDFNAKAIGEKKALQAKYEKEMADIKAQFEETAKQLNEVKRSSMSDKERAELDRVEKEKALVNAQMQAEKNYNMYAGYRVKSEIARIVNKYADRLNAPEYIPIIIENMFRPELKGDAVMCGESDLEAVFTDFLKSDKSKSLLRNTLNPGASTVQQTINNNGTKSWNFKSEDVANDPAVRREYMAAMKAGKQPKLVD